MSKEPVAIGAGVVALVNAVVQLVVLLGIWDATADQLAALNTVVVSAVSLVMAVITRRRTYSEATVQTATSEADLPPV